jgi:hypothetical protein
MKNITRFEPAFYSIEECEFLFENVGKAPAVALHKGTPQYVNPKAVRPVLEKVYELEELQKHSGSAWIGLDALKEVLRVYIDSVKGWEEDKQKGAPYPPTMFEWDSRGRARFAGVGSDAHYVNTFFDENGNRRKLGIHLTNEGIAQKYIPEWARRKMEAHRTPDSLIIDEGLGHVTCPVCQFVVNYDPTDTTKLNMAKAQMGKHMLKSTKSPDDHKAAYGAIFRSGGQQVS